MDIILPIYLTKEGLVQRMLLRALIVEPTTLKILFSLVLPIFQLIHLSHIFISQGKSLSNLSVYLDILWKLPIYVFKNSNIVP